MGRPIIDITGQRFGKLVVTGLSQRRTAENKPYWHCRCDCGVTAEIVGGNLRSGQSRSCGCERRLRAGANGVFHGNTFIDLTGHKFDRWTVESFSRRSGKTAMWNCRCECGTQREVSGNNLNRGYSRSCGCWHREIAHNVNYKHGHSAIRGSIYNSWVSMRNRCNNRNDPSYKYYGGRGITYCERWEKFENFLADMEPTWQECLSLDRIDNDGNYAPENCRWATQSEQVKNQRHTPRGSLEERGWKKEAVSSTDPRQLSFSFMPSKKAAEHLPRVRPTQRIVRKRITTLEDLGFTDE